MNVRGVMRGGVITIDPNVSVLDAMKRMVDERITSLIVQRVEDNSTYGIITRKDIVNKAIANGKDVRTTKVSDIMSEPILTISADQDIETVARLMAKTDIRRFPVMENDKIIGLVSNSDILKAVNKKGVKMRVVSKKGSQNEGSRQKGGVKMRVVDIMKKDVKKIREDATASDAMEIMIENDIGSLLVNGEDDYGIVTRKDIVNKAIAYGKDLSEIKVGDIMTKPILTISSDMNIKEAARLMAKTNVRRFPVVNGRKLVGIISNSDILKAAYLEAIT